MDPIPSVLMLVALYQAAEYGGSVSSILLGVPGTAGGVATVLDGHEIAKQGFPGKALGYSLTASTIGGLFGAIVLFSLSQPLTKITLKFSDPEFFLLGLFALLCIISLSSKDVTKSFISVLLGLLAGMIGVDLFTGELRFTGDIYQLFDGLNTVTVITGLFAVSAALSMLHGDLNKRYVTNTKNLKTHITWKEYKAVNKNVWRGSIIGTVIGIIPGVGATLSSWVAYSEAKRNAKDPEKFGKGEPNGIAAPEASNNAVVGASLIPLITLGIPGSAATAVILGAFIMQGIQPGPQVFSKEPDLVYSIMIGLIIATFLMYLLGRVTTTIWARLLTIPNYILIPMVLIIPLLGIYSARGYHFDLWIAIAIGIVGFLIMKLDYSFPGFILAFILSPIIETHFRRSLMLSDGNYNIFITRGFCIAILAIIIFLIVYTFIDKRKKNKKAQSQASM